MVSNKGKVFVGDLREVGWASRFVALTKFTYAETVVADALDPKNLNIQKSL